MCMDLVIRTLLWITLEALAFIDFLFYVHMFRNHLLLQNVMLSLYCLIVISKLYQQQNISSSVQFTFIRSYNKGSIAEVDRQMWLNQAEFQRFYFFQDEQMTLPIWMAFPSYHNITCNRENTNFCIIVFTCKACFPWLSN